jgi:hypothetical protein
MDTQDDQRDEAAVNFPISPIPNDGSCSIEGCDNKVRGVYGAGYVDIVQDGAVLIQSTIVVCPDHLLLLRAGPIMTSITTKRIYSINQHQDFCCLRINKVVG